MIQQGEDETLQEFGARCSQLAEEGYAEGAGKLAMDLAAIDAFSRGTRDRQAAYEAGQNRHLETLQDHIDFHRHSIANHQLVYGDMKIRQVSELEGSASIPRSELEERVSEALAKAMRNLNIGEEPDLQVGPETDSEESEN